MLKKLLILFVLFISIQSFSSAEQSSDLINKSQNDSSNFLHLNLKENKQRIGFEIFFWITNMFIDNHFLPNIPKELYNQTDLFKLKEKLIEIYQLDEYIDYIKMPFKMYPSLTAFTIMCLVITLIIPIIGFSLCCYRCCCRSAKFNPYDRKTDSFLRKINSFFMFIILTAILLTTITLFFTNQNSLAAVHKSADIYNRNVQEFKDIKAKKLPEFISQAKINLKQIQNDTFFVLKNSFDRLAKIYLKLIFKDEKEFNYYDKQFNDEIMVLKHNLTSNKTTPLIKEFYGFLNDKQKKTIDIFLAEVNNQNSALNTMDRNISLEAQITFLFGNSVLFSDFNSIFDQINEKIPLIQQNIQNITNQYLNEQNAEYLHQFENYYEFFYITLMGLCLLVLFLFILYSSGLGGICARRKHNNIKQTCHRGVSANFLMSGVVFYFLFSWMIVIASILLFVPGIAVRHVVCKPLIELDNNSIFREMIKNKLQFEFNFTKALNECDNTGKSEEINAKISSQLTEYFLLNTSAETIYSLAESKLPHIRNIIEELDESLNLNYLTQLDQQIDEYVQSFTEISQLVPEEKENLKILLSQVLEYLKLIKIAIIKTKEAKQKLQTIIERSSFASFEVFFKKELKNEIYRKFFPELKHSIKSNLYQLMQSLPSCRILSNVYKEIIVTGCYEYLDNINAFWSTLLFTVLLFFLLTGFAICQSDLFRKHYPYDQITNESPIIDSKLSHSNKNNRSFQMTKNPNITAEPFNSIPIDAYEMENYSNHNINKQNYNANQLNKPLNRSPPPQYRDADY